MKINNENIEALIVDYIDGNLTPQQSAQFEHFISQNPEYRALLDEYMSACADTISDNNDNSLGNDFTENLKHTSDFDEQDVPYFDRLAVLNTESIATEAEKHEYSRFVLQSNQNLNSAALYSKCKIQENNNIHYPFKQSLKHSNGVRKLWYYVAAAAAVIIMALLIKPLYNNDITINNIALSPNHTINTREVAVVEPSNNTIPTAIPTPIKPKTETEAEPKTEPIPEPETIIETVIANVTTDTLNIIRRQYSNKKLIADAGTMHYIAIDYNTGDDLINIDYFTFIGERGINEVKHAADRIHRRNKKHSNPKICISYNDEGKLDGMSLLIGNRELRVWSR